VHRHFPLSYRMIPKLPANRGRELGAGRKFEMMTLKVWPERPEPRTRRRLTGEQ
jgi:hypothetical protein